MLSWTTIILGSKEFRGKRKLARDWLLKMQDQVIGNFVEGISNILGQPDYFSITSISATMIHVNEPKSKFVYFPANHGYSKFGMPWSPSQALWNECMECMSSRDLNEGGWMMLKVGSLKKGFSYPSIWWSLSGFTYIFPIMPLSFYF